MPSETGEKDFKGRPDVSAKVMMSAWCAGGHKDIEETSLRYTATAPRQCSGFVMQAGVLQPCECPCHSR